MKREQSEVPLFVSPLCARQMAFATYPHWFLPGHLMYLDTSHRDTALRSNARLCFNINTTVAWMLLLPAVWAIRIWWQFYWQWRSAGTRPGISASVCRFLGLCHANDNTSKSGTGIDTHVLCHKLTYICTFRLKSFPLKVQGKMLWSCMSLCVALPFKDYGHVAADLCIVWGTAYMASIVKPGCLVSIYSKQDKRENVHVTKFLARLGLSEKE